MVSEDSDQLVPGLLAVHGLGDLRDLHETVPGEVTPVVDHPDDLRELLEVLPLRRLKRIALEERDDPLDEVHPPPHDVAVQMLAVVVVPPIGDHGAHPEELTELMEAPDARCTLRHRELMSNLPSGSVAAPVFAACLADEADREASFSVYETDDPATELDQPFLLIVRTDRIVTAHELSLGRVPDGYTGFPAYGRMRTALLPARGAAIVSRHLRTVPVCYGRERRCGSHPADARSAGLTVARESGPSHLPVSQRGAWRMASEDSARRP
jgi:hypothetical protein